MKAVEEFYREIMASKELREELKKASDEMMEAFLKQHGCNADAKEFMAFVRAQSEGAIDDDAAVAAAGGAPPSILQRPKLDSCKRIYVKDRKK